ncbi:hypothetical protein ETAE_0195 [Edwardsiella piscicida]|uniref:Uncharacterized protein n=2 Tax=Edwardsiella TaxID=635 RepID=A0A0H3DP48_EDWTF|nr:hypothetical protein ETAE_0195 [Edwardsiella tarda EIB202]ADM40290.1 hypothetical protein ETAF_0167 [Edwardsiella tarda FL6-60]
MIRKSRCLSIRWEKQGRPLAHPLLYPPVGIGRWRAIPRSAPKSL